MCACLLLGMAGCSTSLDGKWVKRGDGYRYLIEFNGDKMVMSFEVQTAPGTYGTVYEKEGTYEIKGGKLYFDYEQTLFGLTSEESDEYSFFRSGSTITVDNTEYTKMS